MARGTTRWDTAEVLSTPEMRAAYWDEVLANLENTEDLAFMRKALTTLERARTMHGTSFDEELIQSAREALAIAEGKVEHAAVYHPEEADLVAIQEAPPVEQEQTGLAEVEKEL